MKSNSRSQVDRENWPVEVIDGLPAQPKRESPRNPRELAKETAVKVGKGLVEEAKVRMEASEVPPPLWAQKLVRFLDDGLKVPGTEFKFGADAIIGFFLPGIGDAVTGTGAAALVILALKERVNATGLGKMAVNILVDTLVGSIPVLGDMFDVVWKSNRRNLKIIEEHKRDIDQKVGVLEYALVGSSLLLILIGVFLPFFLFWLLTSKMISATM